MKTTRCTATPAHTPDSTVIVDRPRSADINGKTGTIARRLGSSYEVKIGEDTYLLHGGSLRAGV